MASLVPGAVLYLLTGFLGRHYLFFNSFLTEFFGTILSTMCFCAPVTIIRRKYSKVKALFLDHSVRRDAAFTPQVVLEGEGVGIFQMVGCCLFGWPLSHKAQHNGDPVAVEKLCASSLTGPLPLNFNGWCHNLPSEWRRTVLFFGGGVIIKGTRVQQQRIVLCSKSTLTSRKPQGHIFVN